MICKYNTNMYLCIIKLRQRIKDTLFNIILYINFVIRAIILYQPIVLRHCHHS